MSRVESSKNHQSASNRNFLANYHIENEIYCVGYVEGKKSARFAQKVEFSGLGKIRALIVPNARIYHRTVGDQRDAE